jgi:hypothetical protein
MLHALPAPARSVVAAFAISLAALAVALIALLALLLLGAGLSRWLRALAPNSASQASGPRGKRRGPPTREPQPLPPEFEGDPSLQWLQSLRDGGSGPRFR